MMALMLGGGVMQVVLMLLAIFVRDHDCMFHQLNAHWQFHSFFGAKAPLGPLDEKEKEKVKVKAKKFI